MMLPAKLRQTPWLTAAAAAIVLYALVRVASLSPVFSTHQLFGYYQTYEHGYVHRGLIGAVLNAFFGFVPADILAKKSIAFERVLRYVNVLLLSALLLPRLLLSELSPRAKWLLIAAAAAVLWSPNWKWSALLGTYLDKHLYFFALLSVAALVFRRPFLFCLFSVLGILMHRGEIFYTFPLACMAAHAVWRFGYPRIWLFAAAAPVVVFWGGMLAHNPDAAKAVLSALPPLPDDEDFEGIIDANQPETLWYILAGYSIYTKTALLNFLFFGFPPLVAALVLAFALPRMDGGAAARDVSGRIKLFLAGGKWAFVVAAAAVFFIQFFTTNVSRLYGWSWYGLGLALVYYVWLCRPPLAPPRKKGKRK